MNWILILTAYRLTCLKDLSYLRVHVNHHVLFCLNLVVSFIHLWFHPNSERLAHYRVDDVGDVLPGQLLNFLFNWKVLVHSRILLGECLHVFDWQAFKLGNVDMLDISRLNTFFGPRLNISQMPDCYIFKWWQEDVHFRCKESVNLTFALKLGSKLGSCNLLVLIEHLGMSSPRWYLIRVVHGPLNWSIWGLVGFN